MQFLLSELAFGQAVPVRVAGNRLAFPGLVSPFICKQGDVRCGSSNVLEGRSPPQGVSQKRFADVALGKG